MNNIATEEAVTKRFPEGVALIVCKDENGKVNATPIGWFMLCNSKPRCWAISLYQSHYSNKVITETKEFVLCLPSYSQKKDILYCGSVHGWDTDKLKNCDLQAVSSKQINPPIIKECIACFECKVINSVKAPDHTIFIGEIVESYVSERTDKLYNQGNHRLFDYEINNTQ